VNDANREPDLHAALELLDHQVVTLQGRMAGKVDDLEIDLTADPPVLSAILMGPQAWGRRFPGLFGRFVVAVHKRMHEDPDPQPYRIPTSHITDITTAVEVAHEVPEAERGMGLWVREQFIDRIPGSRHAAE
jgi:sporulation protein YlmC with PRC-barrel domain